MKEICKNIVMAGDLWNVKGFKALFKRHVYEWLKGDKFPRLKRVGVLDIISN